MFPRHNFEKSTFNVIKGRYAYRITNILYLLCIYSISNNRDAIFIDGSNVFNPYIISRMAKYLGVNQRKVLRHIHISRAFTEYQMEAIISDLDNIIKQKNPGILAISSLFYDEDNKNINFGRFEKFEKLIDNIKLITKSSGVITIISGIDSPYYNILETKADNLLDSEELNEDFNIGDLMGRTVPSFRYHLEEIISELQIFRRALHGEDKIAFDNLIEKARRHASSCTIVPTLDPLNCILLSMLIEQQKEINSLKEVNSDKL